MINVLERGASNNGDIIIIPRREVERIADDYDEVTVNRVRYQIPEDTVILDFFGRISGGAKYVNTSSSHSVLPFTHVQSSSRTTTIRKPINRNFFDNLNLVQPNGHYDNTGSLSPLTSLDELSSDDGDLPSSQDVSSIS